jgi:hypothetical protein
MVHGLPRIEQVDQVCDGCLVGKQRRFPFPAASKFRARRQLELVHADLCGPITPETPSSKTMFLLAVDDMSRYMWLVLLATKDEAATTIIRLQARAEAEVGHKLGTLRTDRGGEFTARAFGEYCAGQGIQRHLTAPYMAQQNGVIERRNQTVLGMARCMLKAMGIPGRFWGEAVTTAVFVLNRAPTRSLEDKTPYEAWYGSKPTVHFLCTFGYVAHVQNTGGHLRKLDDRSTPMVFIGYKPGTKAYRLYNPVTDRVHVSRDVVFEEGRAWNWNQGGAKTNIDSVGGDPFIVEYVYVPGAAGAGGAPPSIESTPRSTLAAQSAGRSTMSSTPGGAGRSATPSVPVGSIQSATPSTAGGANMSGGDASPPQLPGGVEFVSPPSQGLDLDADNDVGDPLRFRLLDDIYARGAAPLEDAGGGTAEGELLLAAGDREPATFEEAKGE